ncbi:response regulator [Eubacteriales bacterium OttesenSCG-928-N13]|nr:response regulator [Eubacteriales bacterium OttesenSCG-928-N13]
MKRVRVMLADDNETMLANLVHFLSQKQDIEMVATVKNGADAKEKIVLLRPDVLVLDLIMPQQDGYAVLRSMRTLGIRDVRVIILSGLTRDGMIRSAMDLGAYYYLSKPIDLELLYQYIVEEDRFSDIEELNYTHLRPKADPNVLLDIMITETVGISMRNSGGRYLHTAVKLAGSMDSLNGRITKELYPAVAQLHDTDASRVERAIRYSIERAWTRGPMRDSGLFHTVKPPSNGEVIMALAKAHQAQSGYAVLSGHQDMYPL